MRFYFLTPALCLALAALAEACSGKAAGDECSFAGPQGGQATGQCVQASQGNELVCHPRRQ